jgi:hypothetical protein
MVRQQDYLCRFVEIIECNIPMRVWVFVRSDRAGEEMGTRLALGLSVLMSVS